MEKEKYIGMSFGCFKIINTLDEKDKHGSLLYNVECNVCHKKFKRTLHSLKKLKTKRCVHLDFPIQKNCMSCGKPLIKKENENISSFNKRNFCDNSCSATYLNLHKEKDYPFVFCLNCNKEIPMSNLHPSQYKERKFCCNNCQHEYYYKNKIESWKKSEDNGLIGKQWIDLCSAVRKYIFNKYENKCARCGWNEINPFTNTLPLEIEHIDGDATNNKEENLILLCPNCHSLTATYRGANKGKGTRNIKWLSRDGKQDN